MFTNNGAEFGCVLVRPLREGGVTGDIVDYHDAVRGQPLRHDAHLPFNVMVRMQTVMYEHVGTLSG